LINTVPIQQEQGAKEEGITTTTTTTKISDQKQNTQWHQHREVFL
jgi:hypothetical protein